MTIYKVTRRFTAGPLEGIEHTCETTIKYQIGFECKNPIGGSPYIITAVSPVDVPYVEVDTETAYDSTQRMQRSIRVF